MVSGEYYPSDSYRPHAYEPQPPFVQDFGSDFDPSVPLSANPEADVFDTGDIDITGVSIPSR